MSAFDFHNEFAFFDFVASDEMEFGDAPWNATGNDAVIGRDFLDAADGKKGLFKIAFDAGFDFELEAFFRLGVENDNIFAVNGFLGKEGCEKKNRESFCEDVWHAFKK